MADKKIKQTSKEEKRPENKAGELLEQIKKAKSELSTLEMDHSQRKLKNTSSLSTKRKEIARLLTALRLIELTNEKNA